MQQKNTERQSSSLLWDTPPIPTIARAQAGQSQEWGNHSRCLMLVRSQSSHQWAGVGGWNRDLSSSIPVWNMNIPSSIFLFFDWLILKVRVTVRKRQNRRNKEIVHVVVNSPNGCNGQHWARLESGQQLHPGLICEWQRSKHFSSLPLLFPGQEPVPMLVLPVASYPRHQTPAPRPTHH